MHVITKTKDLAAACQRLAAHDYVTVDTEFLRETTFWPKLCVIQMAGPDMAFIVDALSEGLDLEPFFELMRDGNVTKVFHAARQDIEIIYHLGELIPAPLFDTQVAAMVCGFGESVGYDTLVTKITGKGIDKSSRFTDWSRRPLTERQLKYAEADVTHLRKVYKYLRKQLEKSGRSHWLTSEMAILESPETYFIPPENAWKRIKARSNKPRFFAILQAIAAWREEQAHHQDIPRSRILRDEALLEIASNPPKDAEKLSHVRGIGKKFAEGKMGAGLLAAVRKGQTLPDDQCPAVPQKTLPPKGLGPLMDLLKVLLKSRCEEGGVAQKLICNSQDLEKIAADSNADIPALKGWRYEVFGQHALALKEGKIGFTAENNRIRIIDLS